VSQRRPLARVVDISDTSWQGCLTQIAPHTIVTEWKPKNFMCLAAPFTGSPFRPLLVPTLRTWTVVPLLVCLRAPRSCPFRLSTPSWQAVGLSVVSLSICWPLLLRKWDGQVEGSTDPHHWLSCLESTSIRVSSSMLCRACVHSLL